MGHWRFTNSSQWSSLSWKICSLWIF